MIRLKADLNAIEGEPVDAKLREALDIAKAGEDDVINWDGEFKLTERIDASFLRTQGKHLSIVGNGPSVSKILPSFPANQHGLVLQNLETLTIKDLAVAGNPQLLNGQPQFDCGNLFYLSSIKQIFWEAAHIYGVASGPLKPDGTSWNPYGLVFIDNCSFDFSRSLISGSTSVGAGLFTLKNINRCHIQGPADVMDYGELAGGTGVDGTYQAKTSLGFTHSWFRFTDPHVPGTTSYLAVPLIESITLDEGARFAVSCEGKVWGPHDAWMRGIRFRDVGINVRYSGLRFNRIENVTIEDSYFTWQENPCLAIEGKDVKKLKLTRCYADKAARTIQLRRSEERLITAEDKADRLILDDCEGFNVDAPSAMVMKEPKLPKFVS